MFKLQYCHSRAPVPEPGQPDYEPESSVEDPENDDGDDAAAPDPLAEAVDGADAEDAGDDENSNDAEEGGDEDAEAPRRRPRLTSMSTLSPWRPSKRPSPACTTVQPQGSSASPVRQLIARNA
ncbi:hypothetical protein JKP88DRAFT_242808 [Tribonema minus]|uniref:Uncharacterized protein n=1 Tax=Tribonema minus TaxID=303371 RepID=A0A835ZGU4_9STRA|nr:hypothetical protein JKP88DRAFT_242808 [Tribonema minus]